MHVLSELSGWVLFARIGRVLPLRRLLPLMSQLDCRRLFSPVLSHFGLIDAFLGGDGVEMGELQELAMVAAAVVPRCRRPQSGDSFGVVSGMIAYLKALEDRVSASTA